MPEVTGRSLPGEVTGDMQKPKKIKGRTDRGLIVVGVIAGIIAITTAGGCVLNQSPDALGESAPSWSADSTKLAFSSDETGNQDIYVMNADGTGRVKLTDREAKDMEPSWSPDGEWIAFLSRSQGKTDIHRVRPDGSGLASLTVHPAQLYSRPIWSPDGTKIAFTSNRDADPPPQLEPTPAPFFDDAPEFPGAAPRPELYVMNADGSGPNETHLQLLLRWQSDMVARQPAHRIPVARGRGSRDLRR